MTSIGMYALCSNIFSSTPPCYVLGTLEISLGQSLTCQECLSTKPCRQVDKKGIPHFMTQVWCMSPSSTHSYSHHYIGGKTPSYWNIWTKRHLCATHPAVCWSEMWQENIFQQWNRFCQRSVAFDKQCMFLLSRRRFLCGLLINVLRCPKKKRQR